MKTAPARDGPFAAFPLPPFAMHASLHARHFAGFALLALAVLFAGCDTDDYDEPRDTVRSFVVDFDLADADFEGRFASIAYEAPEITPDVARRGLVAAYVRRENAFGEITWTALPYTYGVEFTEDPDSPEEAAVDYTATLGYAYETDLLEVFYELSAYDDFVWDRLEEEGRREIKVVVLSQEAARRSQGLDFGDYEAVQQRFGLNE